MQATISAIKDVFAVFTSLGWLPVPLAVAVITMLALRIAFEPRVIQVTTKKDVSRMGWITLGIFFFVACVTYLMQYGLQKPANGFDRVLALGFSLGDTMFAFVITSSHKVRELIRDKFQPTPLSGGQ